MSTTTRPRATAEQRGWYFYDWANSAYITTIGTVLFAPYLTSVAEKAACGFAGDDDRKCTENLHVLGLSLSAGSLVFYVVTLATVLSAFVLPIIGAVADRVESKRRLMCGLAWAGSVVAALMFFVTGDNWQLGAVLLVVANLFYGASIVVYDAILVDIAAPDDRDHVSSQGWAFGYLGGALLLSLNLVVVTVKPFGLSTESAVRISLLSAALWWAVFTIVPYRRIKDHPVRGAAPVEGVSLMQRSFGQLFRTLRELRGYPQTLLFLVAYLFYNDGIQTVIYSASVYGEKELGFGTSILITTILIVQFVAFGGALIFGRVAARFGGHRTIMGGLAVWVLVVCIGFFLPAEQVVPFFVLAVLIGLVLGGTQALSRSFFSQLIPRGREAEYFSLYQACERGTSWFGTLVFGLVHQLTDSYRPAILALIAFFVIGGTLLWRLDPRKGVIEAGNVPPAVL
ncbi:MFS transporter [Aeromicrobium chenweiae]|uniref:MFS transporter n=1 Tax=Aeromicrobium chenweiae TaxID=2079793 RepID=A0A2S0WS99_9ACTN|nr:MFS transporter [Aeromicrobium chenweiae]AWB94124.1 MFS transporter [Aeromicrobium chenweiae]TGN31312.1 MFS transporter [Aeromicrobium chenweiae]